MNEIEIRDLQAADARDVASLHITGISGGFISSLGIDFVTALYEAMAKSSHSFGYVVKEGDEIIGFSSFTTDLGKLYKSVLRKNFFRFFFLLAGKIFSVRTIKKIFETLFYPSRIKKEMDLPSAEFLSMVIAEKGRGKGLATKFVKKGFRECAQRGHKEIKIMAAVQIVPINKLYSKLGFTIVSQIENHGVVSNVYVVDTNHFEEP